MATGRVSGGVETGLFDGATLEKDQVAAPAKHVCNGVRALC